MIGKGYKFELSKSQYEKLEKWYYSNHKKGEYHGAIGGDLTFSITPTSIGDFVEVTDTIGNWIDLSEVFND